MRKLRVASQLLAFVLVASTSWPVFAHGRSDDTAFAWPLQQWQQEHDRLLAVPRSKSLPEPLVVRRGSRASKAVALTFDDGYNRSACARIANILRREGAVGTFFINGQWLRTAPAEWRRILEGMEVANHTRSHRSLTSEPHPVVLAQIRTNEQIHEQLLGRPMLNALRPPYGAYGERVGRIAKQLGYDYVAMWNVDTQDWRPGAKVKNIVRRAIDAPSGSIILMHCARDATAKSLPFIIRHYQRRGLSLAGLSAVLPARPEE
jgi:peptidoglycan/xylan/chitin deacetylase (PgdA/CDA1 family)